MKSGRRETRLWLRSPRSPCNTVPRSAKMLLTRTHRDAPRPDSDEDAEAAVVVAQRVVREIQPVRGMANSLRHRRRQACRRCRTLVFASGLLTRQRTGHRPRVALNLVTDRSGIRFGKCFVPALRDSKQSLWARGRPHRSNNRYARESRL